MVAEATALVVFSPRSILEEMKGPAYSRLWRPGYLAVLIEKSVPTWVVTPIGYESNSIPRKKVITCNQQISGPIEMNLFPLMASLFDQNNSNLKNQAKHENIITERSNKWWIADKKNTKEIIEIKDNQGEVLDRLDKTETIYPSGKIYELSFESVARNCRVTIIRYPDSYLNQTDGVIWMRSIGVDVDEFVYKSAGIPKIK
jgi:hypothetical protein